MPGPARFLRRRGRFLSQDRPAGVKGEPTPNPHDDSEGYTCAKTPAMMLAKTSAGRPWWSRQQTEMRLPTLPRRRRGRPCKRLAVLGIHATTRLPTQVLVEHGVVALDRGRGMVLRRSTKPLQQLAVVSRDLNNIVEVQQRTRSEPGAAVRDVYSIVRQAILDEDQIVATYSGHRREMCPHVIGTKNERRQALFFQFAGSSSSGVPAGGEWRCIPIDGLSDVASQPGEWHTSSHSQPQTCVDGIDIEGAT